MAMPRKKEPKKILWTLRQAAGEEAIQRQAGRFSGVSQEGLLQSEVHDEGDGEGKRNGFDAAQEGESVQAERVREMRRNDESGIASHRPKSSQQPQVEPNDLVWIVSQYMALGAWESSTEIEQVLCGLRSACTQIGVVPKALSALPQVWRSLSDEEKTWCILCLSQGPFVSEWPDQPRIESGVPARVDRLRCLGNAIVPQVAEYIGRRIIESLNP